MTRTIDLNPNELDLLEVISRGGAINTDDTKVASRLGRLVQKGAAVILLGVYRATNDGIAALVRHGRIELGADGSVQPSRYVPVDENAGTDLYVAMLAAAAAAEADRR